MRIDAALQRYLVQLHADGRSTSTIDQYRRYVGLLGGWLSKEALPLEVEEITHEHLARFLASSTVRQRHDGGPRKATAANVLRSKLRSFFAYCADAGYVDRNPARLVRRAKCSPPPPRALSEDEVRRLLAAADARTGPAARRDGVLIRLLLGTGLRIGSALDLRAEDIDLDGGEVRVLHAKGNAPVTLPIGRGVASNLNAWLGGRTRGPVFPGAGPAPLARRQAGKRIEEVASAAGLVGRVSPHALRHTFATALYRRTGDVLVVQAALGHRSLASTITYARADATRVRAALAG